MTERQITMTVYRIEADLIDVTPYSGEEMYLPGRTHVYAQGAGEMHSWPIRSDQRCWVGDTVTVTVIEDDPKPEPNPAPLEPPPIDKRSEA
jgi:hypothetical protein